MVTDWSDIAWEFAFVTKRPVLYIDTPMKIMNSDYEKIGIDPINRSLRSQLGEILSLNKIGTIDDVIRQMLNSQEEYSQRITQVLEEHMYNIGKSSEICGRYIIRSLKGAK